MKFTLNWLKEFVAVQSTPEKLAELLTMGGLEVEALSKLREPETGREDWLFEIGVTPNRGDCLGVQGIAREAAVLSRAKEIPALAPSRIKTAASAAKRINVSIRNPRRCPRYSAGIVDGIRVERSPAWLRFRLEACGIRAISNVVDITNYVMLETGQPLHAFDIELLPARHIVVRTAGSLGKFTTLDGIERELLADDLLICDGDIPVALAGVMGGMNSEVGEKTTALLLESANFDASAIRQTAKRLGLHSEASHRFERGVDPNGTVAALGRAIMLLAELAGGTAVPGILDRYPGKPKPASIVLREERSAKLLGITVDGKRAEAFLQSLGVKTKRRAGKILACAPPSSRTDLTREVDLIEELARLHGYDKIPSTLPPLRPSGTRDEQLSRERSVRSYLTGEGFVEVINLPFTSEKLNRAFPGLWQAAAKPVAVMNPLVKENAEMRLSLIPGLIENLRANLAQKAESFRAYHLGKVFHLGAAGNPEERLNLAAILYGPRPRRGLRRAVEAPPDFSECKGLAEGLLDLLRINEQVSWQVSWKDDFVAALHPGHSAWFLLGREGLGYTGQLHPDLCDELGLPPLFVYELDLEKSLEYAPRKIRAYPLPRFPSVGRDFALVVERDFQSQRIVDWIENRREQLIEYVEVFDEYRGPPIPAGKKSLAYKIAYRAEDRTLTDAEINAVHQNLVTQIGKVFGAELRS